MTQIYLAASLEMPAVGMERDRPTGSFAFWRIAWSRSECFPEFDLRSLVSSGGRLLQPHRLSWFAVAIGGLRISVAAGLVIASPLDASAQAERTDQRFDAALQRAAKDGGVRRWSVISRGGLQLFESRSVDAAVVSTVRTGAILSNMGCDKVEDQVWCSVRSFRGGPRGFVLADQVEPARGPDGVVPMGADHSRRRASKRDFDVEGDVPCAQEQGQALGVCEAAVSRGDGGDATVVVTFANGFARKLFFVHGEFVSASATMSGVGRDADWQLAEGVHKIRVDDQRFEVPDALVYGN